MLRHFLYKNEYLFDSETGGFDRVFPDYNSLPLSYSPGSLSLTKRPDLPPSLRAYSDTPYSRPRSKLRRLSLSRSDNASVTSHHSHVYKSACHFFSLLLLSLLLFVIPSLLIFVIITLLLWFYYCVILAICSWY